MGAVAGDNGHAASGITSQMGMPELTGDIAVMHYDGAFLSEVMAALTPCGVWFGSNRYLAQITRGGIREL